MIRESISNHQTNRVFLFEASDCRLAEVKLDLLVFSNLPNLIGI